jgi:hypothetical protein
MMTLNHRLNMLFSYVFEYATALTIFSENCLRTSYPAEIKPCVMGTVTERERENYYGLNIYRVTCTVSSTFSVYLTDLTVRCYFDNTDYNIQLILMYSKTPTCFELIDRHHGVLHTRSNVLLITNTHVGC